MAHVGCACIIKLYNVSTWEPVDLSGGITWNISSLIHWTEQPLMVSTFLVILELALYLIFTWKEFCLRALSPCCKVKCSVLSRADREILSKLCAQCLSQGLLCQICLTLQATPWGEGWVFLWWVIPLSRFPVWKTMLQDWKLPKMVA